MGVDNKNGFKGTIEGFLIALQFFSVLPIRSSFSLDPYRLRRSIQFLPLVGILFGAITAALLYLLQGFSLSPLLQAFVVLTSLAFLSGGLHLDGWMDMSDAYFSYRSRERRLEIMEDSRVGAFAVLSLLFLLGWRFLFIYEIIGAFQNYTFIFIILLPFLSRFVIGYLFIYGKVAKESGLAYTFQQGLRRKDSWFLYMYVLLISISLLYLISWLLPYFFLLCGVAGMLGYLLHRFYHKQFGGITGDLLGATVEGVENGLWLIVWWLHVFVMA